MGKKLIGCHCVDQYICRDEKKIYIGKNMILTPGVKDYLRNKGIALVYGKAPENNSNPLETPKVRVEKAPAAPEDTKADSKTHDKALEKLMINILKILKADFQIEDDKKIKELSLQILNRVNLH